MLSPLHSRYQCKCKLVIMMLLIIILKFGSILAFVMRLKWFLNEDDRFFINMMRVSMKIINSLFATYILECSVTILILEDDSGINTSVVLEIEEEEFFIGISQSNHDHITTLNRDEFSWFCSIFNCARW